jgi:hypothetical protein
MAAKNSSLMAKMDVAFLILFGSSDFLNSFSTKPMGE